MTTHTRPTARQPRQPRRRVGVVGVRRLALLCALVLVLTGLAAVPAMGDEDGGTADVGGGSSEVTDPYEEYGDIGCSVVEGFNDRCPSMLSEPLAPRPGVTQEFVEQQMIFVSPDGSMLYSVGTRHDDFSYSLATITAWRLDPGNLGADGAIAWKRDFGDTAEFPRTWARAAQMSHDGSRLYVTGLAWVEDKKASNVREMWVGAFDTADGEVVWTRKLLGAAEEREKVSKPNSVSVSPDDSQVFASATALYIPNSPTDREQWSRQYALDASTGEVQWQTDYRDHRVNHAGAGSSSQAEGVSPDGSRLFSIVNLQDNEVANKGYAAIAYDAATGEIIWSRKYLFPEEDGRQSTPYNLILSPDGRKVIVAVRHQFNGGQDGARYRFAAYDAIDGGTLWVKEHSANTGTGCDVENFLAFSPRGPALAVNPSGDTVYLTGIAEYRHPDATDGGCNTDSPNDPSRVALATVLLAVDTDSGELRWEKHYGQDGGFSCNPCSITMIPGPNASDAGSRILVTSEYFLLEKNLRQYPWTFLVDAATGDQMWQARYLDTYNDGKTFIRTEGQSGGIVTADGSRVYRMNHEYSPTRGWTPGRKQVIGYDLDPVLTDLTPTLLDVSKPSKGKSTDRVVTVTVTNQGDADATGVVVRLFNGDQPLGDTTPVTIPAGASAAVPYRWDTTGASKPYRISAVVNPDRTVPESNYDNNQIRR